MNSENSKTSHANMVRLNLEGKIDLQRNDNHVSL